MKTAYAMTKVMNAVDERKDRKASIARGRKVLVPDKRVCTFGEGIDEVGVAKEKGYMKM